MQSTIMITLMQALIAASVSVRPCESWFYGPCSPGVHHPTGSYNFSPFLQSSLSFKQERSGFYLQFGLSLCLVFDWGSLHQWTCILMGSLWLLFLEKQVAGDQTLGISWGCKAIIQVWNDGNEVKVEHRVPFWVRKYIELWLWTG